MKLFEIHHARETVGLTPKGRERKRDVENLKQIDLNELFDFDCYSYDGQLERLEGKIDKVIEAIKDILLTEPDKFSGYFKKLVAVANERRRYREEPQLKIVTE